MAPLAKRTVVRDEMFFMALQRGVTVDVACHEAGYQRSAVYRWRKDDAVFAALWREAQDVAIDLLEEEADRRGRSGYDETTTVNGEVRTVKHKYSDQLLLQRLRAMRPERYRDRGLSKEAQRITVEFVVRNHLGDLLSPAPVEEPKNE
jgi:hypothetical protein